MREENRWPLFLLILPVICCGAIFLISLGGAGVLGGILADQWLLIAIGLIILILGLYFYFGKRK